LWARVRVSSRVRVRVRVGVRVRVRVGQDSGFIFGTGKLNQIR